MRDSPEALQALTEAIGKALRADAAVVRLREGASGDLAARTVWATSAVVSAELVGSRGPLKGAVQDGSALTIPIRRGNEVVGELELLRSGEPFAENDVSLAESAAAQAALVLAAELEIGRAHV